MYNSKLHFHFIGIGGSGMSGIAEILVSSGYSVSGSDLSFGGACRRLAELGVPIAEGHAAENLPENASLVVYSSAVPRSNPEIVEAQKRGLPVVKRAEVLAELMRMKFGVAVAGAHGKTTTTSMIGWLLEEAKLDPTVIVGGQVKKQGTGGISGQGDFLVAEADESDRSFLLLKPSVALITNIDREHMSAYGSERELREAFLQFLDSVPFYGLAVLCIDDPYLRTVAANYKKRVITYGFSEDAELRGEVLEMDEEGTVLKVTLRSEELVTLKLPMLGRHLAQNALGAMAVALEFGVAPEQLKKGFSTYPGVERRLEKLGEIDRITVFNDYGHHPAEVSATLGALRESFNGDTDRRLVAIFQPHRYSRTEECFSRFLDCFADADRLFITDIYPAGEQPIEGVSGERLVNSVNHPAATLLATGETKGTELLEQALNSLVDEILPGDVVLLLGAGSIGRVAGSFFSSLKKQRLSMARDAA